MSTRRTPRTLDERVAALEEYVRRLQADTAVQPTDTRYLYGAKGDILVAQGPQDPQAVAAGTPGEVLTVGDGGIAEWQDPDRVRPSLLAVAGSLFVATGDGTYVVLVPGPDGTVLTADSTKQAGLAWA